MGQGGWGLVSAIAALTLAVEVPAGAADTGLFTQSDATIVVRTYAPSPVAADARVARNTASGILERAGVRVGWVDCSLSADERASTSRCAQPLRSNELVMRIVAATPADGPERSDALGFAYLDADSGRGWLATVYSDRVTMMAQKAGVDVAELLGRAMAHEIGHLLLGTNSHTPHGLMRASWSGADLRRNRPLEWAIDSKEAEGMRRGLASRLQAAS